MYQYLYFSKFQYFHIILFPYTSWQPPKRANFTEVRPTPPKLTDKPEYRENEQVEVSG